MYPTEITEDYVRRPLYVKAVQVTRENFVDVARWCFGTIKNKDESQVDYSKGPDPDSQYIKVEVSNPKNVRQSKAYVGDWILYTKHGYKVYTTKAFHASFEKVEPENDEPPNDDGEPDEDA